MPKTAYLRVGIPFRRHVKVSCRLDEVLTMDRGGNTYYYQYDGLGSVTEVTDGTGAVVESYTYDAYGNPSVTSSLIDNPYMFTGRRWDSESGTYYYRARQYNPLIGRFLQRDPIGYYDSLNLYQYTFNSPTNYVDPWGLCGELPSFLPPMSIAGPLPNLPTTAVNPTPSLPDSNNISDKPQPELPTWTPPPPDDDPNDDSDDKNFNKKEKKKGKKYRKNEQKKHKIKKQSTGNRKQKHQKNHPGRGNIPKGKRKKIDSGDWNFR